MCLCVYECVCSVMSNSLLLNLCLLHLLHLQANSLPPASPGKPLPTYTNHFLAINVKLLHFYELSMIQTIFLLICILVLLLIFLKNGSLLFFLKKSLDYEAICLMTQECMLAVVSNSWLCHGL